MTGEEVPDEQRTDIDRDQWIHPDDLKDAYPWRDKHPKQVHPLDFLHERKTISKAQMAAGWTLVRLRSAATLRLDVAKMGQVLKDLPDPRVDDGPLLDCDHIFLLNRLRPWEADVVSFVCWDKGTITGRMPSAREIRDAFEALRKTVEDQRRLSSPDVST